MKYGETCSRYWFNLGKKKRTTEPILMLTQKDGSITRDTKQMTKIAMEYHKELQRKPDLTPEREDNIRKTMQHVPKTLSDEQKLTFSKEITEKEVDEAIRRTQNGKAPSDDGLPYELYRKLMRR